MRVTRALMMLFTCLVLGSLVLALLIVRSDGIIAREQSRRYNSYLLADELRQSSDDLTHMIRAYAATGDSRFEDYVQQILKIRSGELPRPKDYHVIYWDYVAASNEAPRESGDPIALRDLMTEAGFTEEEFEMMQQSETQSVYLADTIETEAANAVKGLFRDDTGAYTVADEPDLNQARQLLYSDEYYRAKANLMRPIEQFFATVDQRTSASVAEQQERRRMLELPLILAIAASVLLGIISIVRMGRFIVQLERKAQEEEERLKREEQIAQRRAEEARRALNRTEQEEG